MWQLCVYCTILWRVDLYAMDLTVFIGEDLYNQVIYSLVIQVPII